MKFPRLLSACLALTALFAAVAPLRAQPAAVPVANPAAEPRKGLIYRIRTSDKLGIQVYNEKDLATICRVDAKGTVNLPLINEIRVYGLTVSEAEKAIATAYREGRFLRKPEVTITVEEYAPREVSIQGQVKSPSRYTLPPEATMSVLDLVTKAGGFTDTAQGTAVRVTRILPDGSTKVFTVDIESLIRGRGSKSKREDNTLLLEPDDIVYVPERII